MNCIHLQIARKIEFSISIFFISLSFLLTSCSSSAQKQDTIITGAQRTALYIPTLQSKNNALYNTVNIVNLKNA